MALKDPSFWLERLFNLWNGLLNNAGRLKVQTQTYTTPVNGELAGTATALQLPDISCRMVMFKARYVNTGKVYLGKSGVTKADGSTDTTTGFVLNPGEATPWIPIDNLSRLYRICDSANDHLVYMALS